MRTRFTGVGTALITPFRKDGSVDEAAVKRLARRQIDGGVHFLVPCGTTGESPTLSDAEKVRVCELVVEEANGAVPVLAGCGGYDTREVIRAGRELERVGVDGFLSVTPYYNKPTQEGLYQHFRALAESTPLPIVLYSIQGRTGINLNVDTVVRLAGIRNIVAVKEASGNIVQMTEIVRQAPEEFLLLSGDDPLTVPIMAIGGRGVISVVSNETPSESVQVIDMCERGDFAGARKLQQWLFPLIQVNFIESNPAPCKVAMAAMGLTEDHVRLPLVTPSAASRDRIIDVLQQLKLLGAAARI
jgi:4-hydroxy-tetrahydrodipicolinate synthase